MKLGLEMPWGVGENAVGVGVVQAASVEPLPRRRSL